MFGDAVRQKIYMSMILKTTTEDKIFLYQFNTFLKATKVKFHKQHLNIYYIQTPEQLSCDYTTNNAERY
jgi:hypothetical protein